MARSAPIPLPDEIARRLTALGARIREARQRRNLRQIDLAERSGLSRSTIESIERGNADTALGSYLRALWVMGLDREIDLVADTALDRDGATLEYDVANRRVRLRKALDNDF